MAVAREAVDALGVASVCQALGLPRATFYLSRGPAEAWAGAQAQPTASPPARAAGRGTRGAA
jgi:putative transposase